ncbi:hypothetical protein [Actinomadura algeriensis]|uniref:Uncharacterized protein n=1 Tax=Actinomadura algeriensis TaxID=1679523 RepID=A0ABR9K4X9_9ACTN|nr:hypothetical protein [Actinomadura algeriensis]MBE1537893.1 hypothetical protein [Actinomadura algeriensis]
MIEQSLTEYVGLPVVTADDGPPAGPVAWKVGTGHAAFPNLRSLFFGDITYDPAEMSWIAHEDISALFPALRRLGLENGDFQIGRVVNCPSRLVGHGGRTAKGTG